MTFNCPECVAIRSLHIVGSINLPPDSRSDDIILQIVRCRQCGFRGAAVYEESRRGSLDSESWDHRGYRLDRKALDELSRLINDCPAYDDKRCPCSSHRALGRKNEHGRWQPPFELKWQDSFPMGRG